MIKASTITKYLDRITQTRRFPNVKIFNKYKVVFNELVWSRNLHDGYECQIFNKNTGEWLKKIII